MSISASPHTPLALPAGAAVGRNTVPAARAAAATLTHQVTPATSTAAKAAKAHASQMMTDAASTQDATSNEQDSPATVAKTP